MLATVHALVAGMIATAVPDPFFASGLSLTSHFFLDSVPHWDFGTNWEKHSKAYTGAIAIGETLFGLILTYALFIHQANIVTLTCAIIASELPDWLEAPWYIFFASSEKTAVGTDAPLIKKFFFSVRQFTNIFHTRAPFALGVTTQIIAVAFFALLLLY
jgi:hypothetical protein